MAIRDIRSQLLPRLAFAAAISSDTTTNGAIIDTKDDDGGIVFTLLESDYTDGTYTPLIEEDDVVGFGSATAVPDDKLIGTEAGAAISAGQADGDILTSIGVFSNKRFVRLSIVSTGTSTGATIAATYQGGSEVAPDAGLSA